MSKVLYDEVPSLDLADFMSGDPERKKKFVQALGAAYTNIGFVAVKNHGLSEELTANLYDVIKRFFALPDEVKIKYHDRTGRPAWLYPKRKGACQRPQYRRPERVLPRRAGSN